MEIKLNLKILFFCTLQLFFLLQLGGCITGSSSGDDTRSKLVTNSLLSEAIEAIELEDYTKAEFRLQRAMRLDAANPEIYYHLASLRLFQNKANEALGFAERGLRFTKSDPDIAFRLWVILAVTRERLGDVEGAIRARERANRLYRDPL